MKNELRAEAQELFFQSNLTKTEIANKLQVSRRTVTLWSHQGNWDSLRRSARTMPAIVAEKCYHLIDHYISGILGDNYTAASINITHAQTINLLAGSIKKLRNRSTVNESMEMFNFFLDGLSRRNPELAAQVAPEVNEFISCRSTATVNGNLISDFTKDATIPFPEKEILEQYQDEKDINELNSEFEHFIQLRKEQTTTTPDTTAHKDPDADADELVFIDSTPRTPPRGAAAATPHTGNRAHIKEATRVNFEQKLSTFSNLTS
jgi:hypothetical protein